MSTLAQFQTASNRNASRSRRFTRFRCTARPNILLTVNPTRRPSPCALCRQKTVICCEKYRRPCLYTRSKSARRSKRALWGNFIRFPGPEALLGVMVFTGHDPKTHDGCNSSAGATLGNRALRRPAFDLWRAGARLRPGRLWFSSASEIRASSSDGGGSAETCA